MADVDVARGVSKNANSYRQACPLAVRTNWRRIRAGSAHSYTPSAVRIFANYARSGSCH
jgi:hypothetical protein